MADIYHHFTINSPAKKVFEAISSSEGLDQWWTKSSSVVPEMGGVCTLNFAPPYIWTAVVTKYRTDSLFELEMTGADTDWQGTKVGFTIIQQEGLTKIHFYHTGWPESNEHFKISSYCWAMYLRILKRYLEFGEKVSYEKRLGA